MDLLNRIFGGKPEEEEPTRRQAPAARRPASPEDEDRQAVERYQYLLRTAPPEQIEQAHAEAFERLTPEQRRMVLDELSQHVPASERTQQDDPRSLARMATRAEMRQPGTLQRSFGNMPAAGGMGGGLGFMGANFLSVIAGVFVGNALFGALFDGSGDAGAEGDAGADAGAEGDAGADTGDAGAGADAGGDFGGGDAGGGFGDFGGDLGGFGGDFGGFGGE